MTRAGLLGSHTHVTVDGINVHIWRRDGQYLARGSYQRQRFGETLGDNLQTAACRLRQLMVAIENGAYCRPSDRCKQPLGPESVPKLTVRELCNAFLIDKRKTRGELTARAYRNRLMPTIEFSELPSSVRRWPLASDVDRAFAMGLKEFANCRTVSRNGCPAETRKPISPAQVRNALEVTRTMVHWAQRADVNMLPSSFIKPFVGGEFVEPRHKKDHLRPIVFPMGCRIDLVEHMDIWQLVHLAIPLLLPLRPEDYTGLLIGDMNDAQRAHKDVRLLEAYWFSVCRALCRQRIVFQWFTHLDGVELRRSGE